jgi:hypothetical protein
MHSPHPRVLALGLGAALLASCTSDVPTTFTARPAAFSAAHSSDKVDLCHRPVSGGRILSVGAESARAHVAHGDYLSTLHVSHDPDQPADRTHFTSIGAALAEARASRVLADEATEAACRITIVVAPGTYQGTVGAASGLLERFPLLVDVPDITLQGALAMAVDDAGRATGESMSGGESVLAPIAPLPFGGGVSTPIIVANAHPGGSAGNGLVVSGFVFQSGQLLPTAAGGQGILSLRTTGLTIRGNRFERGFTESLDLRASSADVRENHLSGTAGTCDMCLAGPGTFTVAGNRLLAGGIPGIAVSPTVLLPVPPDVEQYVLPATAETWADIRNNEVRDHRRVPVGVGVRMDAVGVGAPNVYGTVHAIVQENSLLNNRFAIMVHAAFTTPTTNRRGDVELTLGGNVLEGSCQTDLLVSLARHQTAIGLATTPYLLGSTFRLTLNGDVSWADAWYSHAPGLGNSLIVDGADVAPGARHFYSGAGCPGA